MKEKDLKDLMGTISSSKITLETLDTFDYKGYGVVQDLRMSREDLRKATLIMWDICMEMESNQRDSEYLFNKGLIKAKDSFLILKNRIESNQANLDNATKEDFLAKEEAFKQKLINIKPLIEVLIKLKEVL